MIRDPRPEDFEAIGQIHKDMGMDYKLPQLDHPLFFVRKVAVDDQGKVIGACFLRLTAETYLWLSPEQGPRQKMVAMVAMQDQVISEAYDKGIDDIEARIPLTVETIFKKGLKRLGWTRCREGWMPWSRSTHGEAR